ncbi:hypothetical protein CP533_0194 [Ophiocordyceps camponoti-saundersi (nom. inval.)]|nr:hypothetical protein CP533_0194 [Ophiocordyceps camponoti-saundersi (nom. inval.)]
MPAGGVRRRRLTIVIHSLLGSNLEAHYHRQDQGQEKTRKKAIVDRAFRKIADVLEIGQAKRACPTSHRLDAQPLLVNARVIPTA